MPSATVLPPEGGEKLSARGSTLLFKAITATTQGAFSLHERHVAAGGRRPPPHVHLDRTEAFWVLSGLAQFHLDGDLVTAGPGAFVLVPGGVAHTFGAATGGDARLLVLHTPALDGYFRELQELWSGDEPPTSHAEKDLMRRHGMSVATDAGQE